MDVAAKVRQLKEAAGLSTNKLAKIAGISQSYMRDIEIGKSQPTVDVLSRICGALGLTLAEFFAVDDDAETIVAAHRSDDDMADLPPEAREELEKVKQYIRFKYGKKE